jgi:hypothetical protein
MTLNLREKTTLLDYGRGLSPWLESNPEWHAYLEWVLRQNMGVTTKHDVDVLGYGFNAGWRRHYNKIQEFINGLD